MAKPTLSLIWGQDRNGLIGRNNALPWHLPADLAWFKRSTMGKPILMGRKTHESIGRPLPGRTNLILTRQTDLVIEGCTVVHSPDEVLAMVPDADEIMVMGGAEIYALLFDRATRLYITEIEGEFEGDAWFPEFDRNIWKETFRETHQPDEKNPYPYTFLILERPAD
ncbi:dihydrofolate reductase [Mariprofundus ferrinatatus]|uniref:Dihydrofolate reductase n=1 Tax=Mariprofundus ferrinatatus TaxID=1921087 RepID=A0A2K8LAC1_9PROT|nr:type 3 dihydrofolate reductase [Mariprofundus ferrinatatus]ATX82851.1 dihydrofolate reductase [Mariprofundus ferrinatatus]